MKDTSNDNQVTFFKEFIKSSIVPALYNLTECDCVSIEGQIDENVHDEV